MKKCVLSQNEIDCLFSLGISFSIPADLSILSKDKIIAIARAIDREGFEFVDDEPTDKCLTCERIMDKIQDNLYPDIYSFLL